MKDITYVSTVGVRLQCLHHRRLQSPIVGWSVSNSLAADLALDALEMAIWAR